MAASESHNEPGRQIELSKADEISVPREIKNWPRFIYWEPVIPIIIFVSVNASCLGVTYSIFPCLSLIVLIVMFLVSQLPRRINALSFCALISVFPFYMCVIPFFDPIRRQDLWIQSSLLKQTPPGTPRNEVRALIAEKGWEAQPKYLWDDYIKIPELQRPIPVVLGTYQSFGGWTWRYAEWFFDEEGKVLTVKVSTNNIGL
jgi:hypothetical protein